MKQLLIIIFLAGLVLACKKSNDSVPATDCSTVPKSWSANVSPIISTRCALTGCHGSGSINGPGELLTYQQVFDARANIRAAVTSGTMPKGSALTQAQINTIVCWIDSGAPNN